MNALQKKMRRRRVQLGLFASLVCIISVETAVTQAFLSNAKFRNQQTKINSTAAPRKSGVAPAKAEDPTGKIMFVDFWGTKYHCDDDERMYDLPVDSTLDQVEGELPPGSYFTHGSAEYDTKRACRIIVSLDWRQKEAKFQRKPLDSDHVIQQIHKCIDSGFQTFQLSPECNDVEMIGRVLRETPGFVEMHWVVALEIPEQVSRTSVRDEVFDLLSRTQTDCIDTLLVPYQSSLQVQYHLEILDILQDMRRDGLIRSIGVKDWPMEIVEEAIAYGLSIDIWQKNANLLFPDPQNTTSEMGITEWWTNPLARNFLSGVFIGRFEAPTYAAGWGDVEKWFESNKKLQKKSPKPDGESSKALAWKLFHLHILETLRELSFKYEVNIETIVLRWSLQAKVLSKSRVTPSSVVYHMPLVEEPEDCLKNRLRKLRDVFRFQLDGEDMERLNCLVATMKPKVLSIMIDDVDVPIGDIPTEFLKEFEANNPFSSEDEPETDDIYPEINFDNPALWL